MAYSSPGSFLASAAGDGAIFVWAVDAWGHHQLQATIQEPSASEAMAITPDEKILIYALMNNDVVLRDLQSGETLQRVAMSPGGVGARH
ncbi:MAG: WD40 repeat domain-containing protein [Caldilineaceae bacterium]